MLRNYLKIAYRNLARQKGYTLINIAGLAVGMAVCLLIFLFLYGQWRTDRFHENADRIYRVTTWRGEIHLAASPPALAPVLETEYAGIAEAVRLAQWGGLLVRGEDSFSVEYLYAEDAFLRVFDFRLAAGDPQTALDEPYEAVLSQATARKIFGSENPVGETFRLKGTGTFTVTGVMAEPPGPTHLDFDLYLSYATRKAQVENLGGAWTTLSRYYTYVLLEEGTAPAAVEAHLKDVQQRRYAEMDQAWAFELQALTNIALGPGRLWNDIQPGFLSATLAYNLAGLALLVLLAAGFNYVNLTVARSLGRAKEIGVRKTLGAHRLQVAGQFLFEAVLIALVAVVGAALLVRALVPAFNNLLFVRYSEGAFTFEPFQDPMLLLLLGGFAVLVGLLAGSYPALILSRPEPTRILKQQGRATVWRGLFSMNLRRGLLTLTLVFALVLTVSTTVLYQQAASLIEADLGYRTENVLAVDLADVSYATFRNEARSLPGVEGVTAMSDLFIGSNVYTVPLSRADRAEEPVRAYYYAVDSNFVRRMEIARAARGSDAAARFAGGGAVFLNGVATRVLGFARPQAALGAMVSLAGEGSYFRLDDDGPFVVAGVVSGLYYRGYSAGIGEPLVLHYNPDMLDHALLLTQAGALPAVAERAETLWERFGTVYRFDGRAYGDMLRASYAYFEDLIGIVATTALLAILICCLGLLGMAAYATRTRVKEIGIRKVFGASAFDIVRLLSKDFVALFALATLLAVPLALLLNRWWLQSFAHPVDVGVWTFAGCIGALFVLVLAVVGSQTIKAAFANPADSLRYE